jgi:nicotinamidase-related amidase
MVDVDIVPARTALLTIDLQNLFVEGYRSSAPDGLATLDRVNKLAAVCRGAGLMVIHARHVLRPDGSNMGVLGDMSPAVRAGLLRKGGAPTDLHRARLPGAVPQRRDGDERHRWALAGIRAGCHPGNARRRVRSGS